MDEVCGSGLWEGGVDGVGLRTLRCETALLHFLDNDRWVFSNTTLFDLLIVNSSSSLCLQAL